MKKKKKKEEEEEETNKQTKQNAYKHKKEREKKKKKKKRREKYRSKVLQQQPYPFCQMIPHFGLNREETLEKVQKKYTKTHTKQRDQAKALNNNDVTPRLMAF